jgi:hypothetical protein
LFVENTRVNGRVISGKDRTGIVLCPIINRV